MHSYGLDWSWNKIPRQDRDPQKGKLETKTDLEHYNTMKQYIMFDVRKGSSDYSKGLAGKYWDRIMENKILRNLFP